MEGAFSRLRALATYPLTDYVNSAYEYIRVWSPQGKFECLTTLVNVG